MQQYIAVRVSNAIMMLCLKCYYRILCYCCKNTLFIIADFRTMLQKYFTFLNYLQSC